MGELEELRARVAGLEARLAAEPYLPALPSEHDGQPIEWRPWEEAPTLTHIDNGCAACAHPGPSLVAHGYAPLLRYQAHRCPACQETRVWERVRDWRGLTLVEIAYSPPRTIVRADGGEA